MDNHLITLIWGIAIFIIVFVINYFLILKKGYKKIEKNKTPKDLLAFSVTTKLNVGKKKLQVNNNISLINDNKKLEKSKEKEKNKTIEDFLGFSLIIPKFNLDINKMNLNYVFILSSLINSFIISAVFVIIYLIPWDLPYKMLIGFVLLFALIYALYELLGRHLVKKGWVKNGKQKN